MTTEQRTFGISLFNRIDQPRIRQRSVSLGQLVKLLMIYSELPDKHDGQCFSPTRYSEGFHFRSNAGVQAVSALVFDLDRIPPDISRLSKLCWIGHTTWSHQEDAPRWRVVMPLAADVEASKWSETWQRARATHCPEADPACKDPSRAYWLPSHRPGAVPEAIYHLSPLLHAADLPPLPERPRPLQIADTRNVCGCRRRGEAYMAKVLANLASSPPGGRNAALNRSAWALGKWVASGALDQGEVEDGLFQSAEANALVADDGPRQTWATIRSGLSAGLNRTTLSSRPVSN